MNPFGVVSFDPNRVWIEDNVSGKIVVKVTTQEEIAQIWIAQKRLAQIRTSLEWDGEIFTVRIPEIVSWDEATGILKETLCLGDNLEILLRSSLGRQRAVWVEFLRKFLEWTKNSGFFWIGFAPRHLLIDRNARTVSIVDFERPVCVSDQSFSTEEFNTFLRGTVHEELCAFLFEEEQGLLFPDIWTEINSKEIPWEEILSSRQKLLLLVLFGSFGEKVPATQLATVQRLLANIITPFTIDGRPFFPLVHLDRIRGAKNYVKTILEFTKYERRVWPHILEAISPVPRDERISSGR